MDQLLNSYIDGELADRQRTEVQRLIAHDPQVAQRVQELQKCKILVNSLPRAEAPGRMLERIKIALESKTIAALEPSGSERRRGAKHLLVRRVLSAAAMIALVAVLGTVVYTIVVPKKVQPAVASSGKLEVITSDPAAIGTVIAQAADNGSILVRTSTQNGKKIYALTGTRDAITTLLTVDMNSVWNSFDSTRYAIKDTSVVVGGAEEVVNLMTPPKPRLTRPVDEQEEPVVRSAEEKKIKLTIEIAGSQ
jgi:hypothetical protein